MKVMARVQGRIFEVEIDNLENQPIIARVDDRVYEVFIEDMPNSTILPGDIKPESLLQQGSEKGNGKPKSGNGKLKKNYPIDAIYSPIPGVVVEIDIVENQEVQQNQIICVIEAMKMKNFIRAPKNGVIRSISVTVGKAVRANEVIAFYK